MRKISRKYLWLMLFLAAGCGASPTNSTQAENPDIQDKQEVITEPAIFGVWQSPYGASYEIGPDVLTMQMRCVENGNGVTRSVTQKITWEKKYSFKTESISWSLANNQDASGCNPTIEGGTYQVSINEGVLKLTSDKSQIVASKWQPLSYSIPSAPPSLFMEWVTYSKNSITEDYITGTSSFRFIFRPTEIVFINDCLQGEKNPRVTLPLMIQFKDQNNGVMFPLSEDEQYYRIANFRCEVKIENTPRIDFSIVGNTLILKVDGRTLFLRPVSEKPLSETIITKFSGSRDSIFGKWQMYANTKTYFSENSLSVEFKKDTLTLTKECKRKDGTRQARLTFPLEFPQEIRHSDYWLSDGYRKTIEKKTWPRDQTFVFVLNHEAIEKEGNYECSISKDDFLDMDPKSGALFTVSNDLLFIRTLDRDDPKGAVLKRLP